MGPESDDLTLNFEKICRTCLCEGELLSLFGKNNKFNEDSVVDMLMECTVLQVCSSEIIFIYF